MEYIPEDLEDAIDVLMEKVPQDELERIKSLPEDSFLGRTHHGFGTGLRNSWGLWTYSRLAKWFINEFKIFHADDMSGIILCSLHRRLNKKDLKLDEQIKKYHDHWKGQGLDIEEECRNMLKKEDLCQEA